MPVVVVTDGDVAAIPYNRDKGYSFRLDADNKGPFAAMIPLSELLDPDKKAHCLTKLKNQFASIPYDMMRDLFMLRYGTYYITNSILHTRDTEARVNIARKLLGDLNETQLEIIETAKPPQSVADLVADYLSEQFLLLDIGKREQLLENIFTYVDQYHIRPPIEAFDLSKIFAPKPLTYSLEEIKYARGLFNSPEEAAQQHYGAMREAANIQKVRPEWSLNDQQTKNLQEALEGCPQFIADCANAKYLRLVVSGSKDINNITPNDMGLIILGTVQGGSTGQGIYASSTLLDHPHLLREEIIHEVERGIVRGTSLVMEPFTIQPAWKRALGKDMQDGQSNRAYQKLVHDVRTFHRGKMSQYKLNATLVPFAQKIDEDDLIKYVEALPDVYHMQAAVSETIQRKGKIGIGGFLGIGRTNYRSEEAIMSAALPNVWQLLHGPSDGMKLIQHPDGTVEEIVRKLNPPTGTQEVLSLRQHCEQFIAELERPTENVETGKGTRFQKQTRAATPQQDNSKRKL